MARHYEVRGAMFRVDNKADGQRRPVCHLKLNIRGVSLDCAVWPKEQSKTAPDRWYYPVTGDYAQGESARLVDVRPALEPAADKTAQPKPATEQAAVSSDNDFPF